MIHKNCLILNDEFYMTYTQEKLKFYTSELAISERRMWDTMHLTLSILIDILFFFKTSNIINFF